MLANDIYSDNTRIPRFIYGTAWKEEKTTALVKQAIHNGFTGIDTANQRVHYHEAAVGEALISSYNDKLISRQDLFLQTKFTYQAGQDHRLPYDPSAEFSSQVQQSFQSSLEHLHTDYIDAYLLHGPSQRPGLGAADYEVWQTMEALQKEGKTRLIGVSNVSLEQLSSLYTKASIKPAIVQNRCFAKVGWDFKVREFCRNNGIHYQGFSLLTANPDVLSSQKLLAIASKAGLTPAQTVFQACLGMDMLVLTGTTSEQHMRDDLACKNVTLSQSEISEIERILIQQ